MTPWSFVHTSDIHIGSPRSFRYQPAWVENWQTARQQIIDQDPDLFIVGGDLTRDGFFHDFEFEAVKADLDGMGIRYEVIPGNMDVGNKCAPARGPQPNNNDLDWNVNSRTLRRFERVFGPIQWSFVYKEVRFSACYAAVAGSGLPEEAAFWHWMEARPDLPRARHHVFVTHYPLFIEQIEDSDFDITDPQQYTSWYLGINRDHRLRIFELIKRANVEIALSGHIHCRRPVQVIDGIRFYKGPATAKSQARDRWADGDPMLGFQRFEVTDDRIQYHFIPLEKVSMRDDGYGPSGHPTPQQRDYSLAWSRGPG